ncbi:AraC family transcriptional regulator [Robbsia sp. KACC 23696]|uniref:AraC family transcriptional regulator n=1 Tax=Robbsia sp. KACC 23696 TaxID=3149231 RepID=UPI00325AC4A6
MADPLAEVVTLLQPNTRFSKLVLGSGRWGVRGADSNAPFYCVLLDGETRLTIDDQPPLRLQQGDFILIPSVHAFAMSSAEPARADDFETPPERIGESMFRVGPQDMAVDTRLLVGHVEFGSPDATLLVSLLPKVLHVRGERRLTTLVELMREELQGQRPARDVVLARLLEVLLIEALRATAGAETAQGLLRGLADTRLSLAIRHMHASPKRNWTVAELAKEAALSRSAFFERFSRSMGVAPMEYLLAWRMALAKHMLSKAGVGVAEVAEHVGYSSASTFSVAFTRFVGLPPMRFAKQQMTGHPA